MVSVKYKIAYRPKSGGGAIMHTISLPNVKSLARFLNSFVRNNPDKEVLTAYIVDAEDNFMTNVKFLQEEYSNQCWLTGYKERLLANALKQGVELNWKPCYKKF